ncbi:MAG: LPS assembly lipoprotein LptE [Pseudomonadales bacterium]
MNTQLKMLAGLVIILALSACGFQLRGAFQVPEELGSVHLSSENPGSSILNNVRRSMVSSGVLLVNTNQEAPYTLHLSRERSEKRSISVDSLAAAAEFQLRQFVSYELRSRRGELLVGPHELIVERNFQNDINNVVGKRDEERLIREEMQVLLASQIMRRYQAIEAAQLQGSGSEVSAR